MYSWLNDWTNQKIASSPVKVHFRQILHRDTCERSSTSKPTELQNDNKYSCTWTRTCLPNKETDTTVLYVDTVVQLPQLRRQIYQFLLGSRVNFGIRNNKVLNFMKISLLYALLEGIPYKIAISRILRTRLQIFLVQNDFVFWYFNLFPPSGRGTAYLIPGVVST